MDQESTGCVGRRRWRRKRSDYTGSAKQRITGERGVLVSGWQCVGMDRCRMDNGMQLWCLEINEQYVKWVIRDRDIVKGVQPDVCRNAVTLLQDIAKQKEKEAKALP